MPFVDLESYVSIKELMDKIGNQDSQVDLDPFPLFQRLALNLSLTLGYGFRINGTAEDEFLREIITVERGISTLRSTSNNWEDFVPLLRIFPTNSNSIAADLRARRDKYLEFLLQRLKDRIAKGIDKPCITGNILKDPEYKLNHGEFLLSSDCLRASLISMISRNKVYLPDNDSRWLGHNTCLYLAWCCNSFWPTRSGITTPNA